MGRMVSGKDGPVLRVLLSSPPSHTRDEEIGAGFLGSIRLFHSCSVGRLRDERK